MHTNSYTGPRLFLKLANICPIPKDKQVIDVNKDLRPIFLTSTLSKIAKDAVIKYNLKPAIMDRLDCNQFGFMPGSNTTLALITLIHRWSKTVDKEGGRVRSRGVLGLQEEQRMSNILGAQGQDPNKNKPDKLSPLYYTVCMAICSIGHLTCII